MLLTFELNTKTIYILLYIQDCMTSRHMNVAKMCAHAVCEQHLFFISNELFVDILCLATACETMVYFHYYKVCSFKRIIDFN